MDRQSFPSAAALRAWLAEHGSTSRELWVGFRTAGAQDIGLTYPEALDEALCAGWIDGVRRRVDAASYEIRFSPRRPGSHWSVVNVRRAGELIEARRMLPAGRAAFDARDPARTAQYSYEARTRPLDPADEEELRANPAARAFWDAQPPSYRRSASWWILSAKRDETRRRRLAELIEDSAAGRRIAAVTLRPRGPGPSEG